MLFYRKVLLLILFITSKHCKECLYFTKIADSTYRVSIESETYSLQDDFKTKEISSIPNRTHFTEETLSTAVRFYWLEKTDKIDISFNQNCRFPVLIESYGDDFPIKTEKNGDLLIKTNKTGIPMINNLKIDESMVYYGLNEEHRYYDDFLSNQSIALSAISNKDKEQFTICCLIKELTNTKPTFNFLFASSGRTKSLTWQVNSGVFIHELIVEGSINYIVKITGLQGDNVFEITKGHIEGVIVHYYDQPENRKKLQRSAKKFEMNTVEAVYIEIDNTFINPITLQFKIQSFESSNSFIVVLIVIGFFAVLVVLIWFIIWMIKVITKRRRQINNIYTERTRNELPRESNNGDEENRLYNTLNSFSGVNIQVRGRSNQILSSNSINTYRKNKDIPLYKVDIKEKKEESLGQIKETDESRLMTYDNKKHSLNSI